MHRETSVGASRLRATGGGVALHGAGARIAFGFLSFPFGSKD